MAHPNPASAFRAAVYAARSGWEVALAMAATGAGLWLTAFLVMPLPLEESGFYRVRLVEMNPLENWPPASWVRPAFAAVLAVTAWGTLAGGGRRDLVGWGCLGFGVLTLTGAVSWAGLAMVGSLILVLAMRWADEGGRAWIAAVWLGASTLQVGAGLVAFALGWSTYVTPEFGRRAGSYYGSPNVLYCFALLAGLGGLIALRLPTATDDLGRVRWSAWRLGLALAVVLALAALILTFSRAGWFGLAAALAWLAWLTPNSPRTRWSYIAVAVLLVLGAALVRTRGVVTTPANDKPTAARLTAWSTGWNAFRQSPWIGGGTGAYRRYLAINRDAVLAGRKPPPDPKNAILNVAIDHGMAGLGCLTLVAAGATRQARRRRAWAKGGTATDRWASDLWPAVGIARLSAGFIDTTVLGLFERSPITASFGILIALAAPAIRFEAEDPSANGGAT